MIFNIVKSFSPSVKEKAAPVEKPYFANRRPNAPTPELSGAEASEVLSES
jgi:hypothetical protein